MLRPTEKYVTMRLKEEATSFGEKVRLVREALPQMELIESVKVIRLLLESALKTRPSYEDLYELCEASVACEVLHDYLRGFFIDDSSDPLRVEMAQRLEGVVSYRLSNKKEANGHDKKLHQTVSEYLLRARN